MRPTEPGDQPANTAVPVWDNDGDADDLLPVAPADIGITWRQPHRFAILIESGLEGKAEAWAAGAINAVAADGPIAILGARHSGVWLINPEYSASPQTLNFPAQPLSRNWEYSTVSALEWGPERPRFLFAASYSKDRNRSLWLIQFKTRLGGLDFVDQVAIPRHAKMGFVSGMSFLEQPRVLVVATDEGIWWASVPANPQSASLYLWHQCTETIPIMDFSCISPVRDGMSVAVAGTKTSGLGRIVEEGIYVGKWTGTGFSFSKSTVPAGVAVRTSRIASCARNPTIVYAVTTDNQNVGMGAVLRSDAGGTAWSNVTIPANHGEQGSYNMCIAVHPSEQDTVVLGWKHGVFLSIDGGQSWQHRPAPHNDQHALLFSGQSNELFGLFVASDGGLGYSTDLGQSWDTRYNKHLLNIEIYAPNNALPPYFDMSPFDASSEVEGLIASATQDNGNLWCPLDDLSGQTFPPWDAFRKADGGDGATSLLLDDETGLWVISPRSGADAPRSSQFKSATPRFFEVATQQVPVFGSSHSLENPVALGRPRTAGLDREGNQLLAVAGKQHKLYGLWRAPGQIGQFTPLAELPADIRSVATYDGTQVLAGSADGQIYLCDTESGKLIHASTGSTSTDAITRLLWAAPDIRFAVNRQGRIIRWDGSQWEALTTGPSRSVFALEFAANLSGGVLFAATMYGVLASQDRGETWYKASEGLPRCLFGTNLRVASSGGRDWLYLSTYGWGVFRADVTPRRSVRIRIPRHDLIRKLLPIVEQRRGITIRDGDVVPVEYSPTAYQLAVTTLINSLVDDAFPGTQASDLRMAAHDLVQRLSRRER